MSCYDAIADTHGRRAAEVTGLNVTVASHLTALYAIGCRDENTEAIARDAHKSAFHAARRGQATGLAAKMLLEMKASMEALGVLGLSAIAAGAIRRLPIGTVILEFNFTLEKKLVSRDDSIFYPNDNPIRKERNFKIPMTPGSTWKGSLRSAAVDNLLLHQQGTTEDRQQTRLALIDIFGDEKGEDAAEGEGHGAPLALYLDQRVPLSDTPRKRKARIRLSPSYYDKVDLDILNRRNRETRAGTVPITLEVVPAGATGRFGIVYLPFDLLGRAEDEIRHEASRDWKLIGEAIHRMFRVSGFGAKKSSGCGKATRGISSFRFECGLPGFCAPTVGDIEDVRMLGGSFGAAA